MQNYMDEPLATYELPYEHISHEGEPVRLYCEAFVGKIDLPDSKSQVFWERSGFNMSSPEAQRYHQEQVYRDDGQVVGAFLMIDELKSSDFSEYVCRISNTEDQVLTQVTMLRKEDDWLPQAVGIPWFTLPLIVLFLLVILSIVSAYRRFELPVRLFWKLRIHSKPIHDGKEQDVVICYSTNDSDFATTFLAQTLRNQYHYTVSLCQIHTARVNAQLRLCSSSSRSVLAVLSPSLFEHQWTSNVLYPFIQQLVDIHPNIILLSQKALPNGISLKTVEGLALKQLLHQTTILEWCFNTPLQRQQAWTKIRLALPIPAHVSSSLDRNDPSSEANNLSTTRDSG